MLSKWASKTFICLFVQILHVSNKSVKTNIRFYILNDLSQISVINISQKKSFSAITAITLPTLVLLSGVYELFPLPGWVDPLIYVGYFLDPIEQIWRYGPLYYSGRVPYIFVGHLFFSIFNPSSAHCALLLFFNGLALGAVFMAAFRLYGRNVAILSTWWLGLNPIWVNSISTGYVDGPTMAFGFVAFACSVFGITRSRSVLTNISFVVSGFFVGITFVTHPVPGGVAALAVLATCFAFKGGWPAVCDLAYVFLGGILGLAISSVYAWQLGAPTIFSFFTQGPMARISLDNASLFAVPFVESFSGSYWAIAPLILLLVSFLIVRRLGRKAAPLALVGTLCLALLFFFLLLWDLAIGGVTLQKHFYVSYLIFGETILVVSMLGSLRQGLCLSGFKEAGLYVAVAASAIVPLAFQHLLATSDNSLVRPISWIALVVLGGATVLFFRAQRSVLAVISLMAITILSGIWNAGTRSAFADANYPSYKLVFEEVTEIRQVADMAYLHGRNVFVWGNRSHGLTGGTTSEKKRLSYAMLYAGKQERFNALDSLAALWAWDRGALGFNMPMIQKADMERLQLSKNAGSVVIVCLRLSDCDQGVAALNNAGFPTSIRTNATVWTPGLEPVKVVIADF